MAQLELMDSTQGKANDAYKTISEVALEIEVPQHVLRFWETHFPQVKPSRMRGSRRYYRPEDIELLKKIKTLLYANGYTIKGAKKMIKAGTMVVEPLKPIKDALPAAKEAKRKPSNAEIKSLVSELRILKTMLASLL